MIPILLMLQGCSFFLSIMRVENRSGSDIYDVAATNGEIQWKIGDLRSGQSTTFYRYVDGEGALAIAWTFNGHRYSTGGCYYTIHGPARGTVVIEGSRYRGSCASG